MESPNSPTRIRFVIFGQGRSGSSLLVHLLNTHPDIHCDTEVMNPFFWNRFSRRTLLPLFQHYPLPLFAYKAAASHRRAYGFKLFADHCKRMQEVIARMHRQGWSMIHIQRQDVLAQAISSAVALTTHQWHRTKDNQVSPMTFSIPSDLVLSRIAHYSRGNKLSDSILAAIPHLDINYESDLQEQAAWPRTSARLLEYLDLPQAPLTSSMIKTYDQPYPELIDNYQEILKAVRSSAYAPLLEYHFDQKQSD